MSKNLDVKKQAVADISEKIKNAKSVVIVEYKGLTVEEVTALRAKFRAAGVDYCVLKNTLVRRALNDMGIAELDELLQGPNAFAFSNSDAAAGPKIIKEFMADDKKEAIKVKAGLLEGNVLDVAGVKTLADLPPKEVLIAKIMGSLKSPATGIVGVVNATMRSLVCVLEAIRKQKAGEE